MASDQKKSSFRFVYLPRTFDGRPAANATRHLAEFDEAGRFVRFHRQTTGKLLLAPGGEEVVEERRTQRRIKRFIAMMKAMGFYQDR